MTTLSAPAFSTLPLPAEQLTNLAQLGYTGMTPIQAQSLPPILAGSDLIAQAKTGSGKTTAFGLGLLNRLNPARWVVQALVVCPTRELAEQVAVALRKLARPIGNVKILTLTGGASARPQIESLAHGAHIIVGTPGRLIDLTDRELLDLSAVHTLVLDEADRMVDMGFFNDVMHIARLCPGERQTLLFSATFPDTIERDVEHLLRDPVRVQVDTQHSQNQIEQRVYLVENEDKPQAVMRLLAHVKPASALVFCTTKAQCADLCAQLRQQGFSALALHGDMEQRHRDDVLMQFTHQSCAVLVATDVAARGLDIPALDLVINVDLARDASVHTHRIGRTGRMDAQGLAISLCTSYERPFVETLERATGAQLKWHKLSELPSGRISPLQAPMVTLLILGGKKAKLRAGDILGALTGDGGLTREQVGKITVTEQVSYVALDRRIARSAFRHLSTIAFKGKPQRMKLLG